MNTTEDPGDGSKTGVMEVSNIPFAAYDVVVYLGIQVAQGFDGEGWIKINETIEQNFKMSKAAPDWTYTRVTNPVTEGNYIVIPGLSGTDLKIEIAGKGFTHLGPTGIQIVESNEVRGPFKITELTYDSTTDEAEVTWNSVPGDSYSISYSQDLVNFLPLGDPVITANSSGFSTTVGSLANPVADGDRLFLQIGPADFVAPDWERVSGVGNIVTLDFSEPLLESVATNISNFSVTDQNGQPVTILSARVGRTNDRIELVLDQPLGNNMTFNVGVSNLVDRAGRALTNSTPQGFKTWDSNPNGVKVFILAGQSNMVGYGETEIGNGEVVGEIGSLRDLVNGPDTKYDNLGDGNGNWTSRSDVKLWWKKATSNYVKGDLTVGYGSTSSRIGPEYAFGQVMGDYYTEPVLLIKAAWGGKSLVVDFRPPGAVSKRGGDVGFYYNETLNNVHEVLDNFDTEFPAWAGQGYEIVGFAWHQGYNDSLSNFPATEYRENIADFITDIRTDLGKPLLPFSLATTGHGGAGQSGARLILTNSQLAITDAIQFPQFDGNVTAKDTRPFWREFSVSPINASHHWYHNAETYYEIGESLGADMKGLLE